MCVCVYLLWVMLYQMIPAQLWFHSMTMFLRAEGYRCSDDCSAAADSSNSAQVSELGLN